MAKEVWEIIIILMALIPIFHIAFKPEWWVEKIMKLDKRFRDFRDKEN